MMLPLLVCGFMTRAAGSMPNRALPTSIASGDSDPLL
jgi:hypothetical protein